MGVGTCNQRRLQCKIYTKFKIGMPSVGCQWFQEQAIKQKQLTKNVIVQNHQELSHAQHMAAWYKHTPSMTEA